MVHLPLPMPDRLAFALDPDLHFLNHGSFGAVPRVVSAAQRAWADRIERDPVAFLWDEVEGELALVASSVAAFVGARPDDVALVENASQGVSTVLRDIAWRRGDRVLTLDHGYGGVEQAVQREVDAHGLVHVRAPIPFPCAGPDEVLAAFDAALADPPRVAILDHITSPTGLVLPIADLVARCKAVGALVIVDGAHAPGQVTLDVPAIGADHYVGNLHKWAFAPRGAAFLWVAPDQPRPAPLTVSHGYPSPHLHPRFHWTGTRDFTAWLATPVGLALHAAWGGSALMARNRASCADAVALLCGAWGVQPPAPGSMRAALGTVPLPGPSDGDPAAARALSRWLHREHRIEVAILPFNGARWARVSAQVHTDRADFQALADAIREVADRGAGEILSALEEPR
jgi:isopenicillin-N epimerase